MASVSNTTHCRAFPFAHRSPQHETEVVLHVGKLGPRQGLCGRESKEKSAY